MMMMMMMMHKISKEKFRFYDKDLIRKSHRSKSSELDDLRSRIGSYCIVYVKSRLHSCHRFWLLIKLSMRSIHTVYVLQIYAHKTYNSDKKCKDWSRSTLSVRITYTLGFSGALSYKSLRFAKWKSRLRPNSITLSGRRQVRSWSQTCSERNLACHLARAAGLRPASNLYATR